MATKKPRRGTPAQLQKKCNELEERLKLAVHELHKETQRANESLVKMKTFEQANERLKLLNDQTYRRFEQKTQDLKYERDLAYAARDENAARFAQMREKVFELEHGLDDRVAKIEGLVLLYKQRLRKMIEAMQAAQEDLKLTDK